MVTLLYAILTKVMEVLGISTKILAGVKLSNFQLSSQAKKLEAFSAALTELQASAAKCESGLNELKGAVLTLQSTLDKLVVSLSPREAASITFICTLEGQTYIGDNMIVKAGQFFTATLKAVDKFGNAAVLDAENPPVFASSNPEIATVTPAADGMSAVITSVGVMGTAQISVTADAMVGPDEKLIVGTLDLQVLPGDAVMVTLEPGPVSDPV
jgi:uncharacterized coiled-coil protein SlyX